MIVGESSPLLSSLVEENERCSKKRAELVSGMHFSMDYLHPLIQYEGGGGGGGGGRSCESYTTMYMHLFLTSNMNIHLMHVGTNDC